MILGELLSNELGLGMKPAFGDSGCSVACLEWIWRITVAALRAIGRSLNGLRLKPHLQKRLEINGVAGESS